MDPLNAALQTSILDIINKITEGTSLSSEEKKTLAGLYFIKYIQSVLEVLMVVEDKNEEFRNELMVFFNNTLNKLPPDQTNEIMQGMEKVKKDVLREIFFQFAEALENENDKQQIKTTLDLVLPV